MSHSPWLFLVLGMGLWLGLAGRAGAIDLALGAPVVLSAWWLYRSVSDPPQREGVPPLGAVLRYVIRYVAPEVLRSTYRVFRKALSPALALSPAIVAVQVPGASRADLILLAYGISLTPGQQIVKIDEEARTLYVHAMEAPDPDALTTHILAVYHRYLEEAAP